MRIGNAPFLLSTVKMASKVEPQSVESEVIRSFYNSIQEVIAHPGGVTAMLYQERVVSEGVVDEVVVSNKPCSEKNAAIMRAVGAAVRGDPKKIWILIAVLESFAESISVANRMRDVLRSRGLEGNWPRPSCVYLQSVCLQLHSRN